MRSLPSALALSLVLALSACPPGAGAGDIEGGDSPTALGGITIRQAVGSYQVGASFHEPVAVAGCTSEEIAGCTLVTCAAGAAPVTDQASLDGGAVTVSTPRLAHTLLHGDDGLYQGVSVGDGELFLNAEELTASLAGGADLEAVTFTLAAPTRIQLTAPPLQAVNVKVTNPIEIAWSNSSAGDVEAILSDAGLTQAATCRAPATSAALTIPAEVVNRFAIGSGRLDLSVVSTTTTTTIDGRHALFFAASSTVTSPTGALAQYNVFFEAP